MSDVSSDGSDFDATDCDRGPRGRRTRGGQRQGKEQRGGLLDGHYKVERTYRPPLMAMPETRLMDWVRDDLPDLLWPVFLIGLGGNGAACDIGGLQTAVANVISTSGIDAKAVRLDGRLTSLERVPASLRTEVQPLLESEISARGLMPAPLLAVLRQYADLPGRWALVDPFEDREETHDLGGDLGSVATTIHRVVRDGHFESMVKFMGVAWDAVTGQLSTSQETVRYLRGYPNDAAIVSAADTVIRAMFGARNGADIQNDPQLQVERVSWAQSFWNQNWAATPCLFPPSRPDPPPETTVGDVLSDDGGSGSPITATPSSGDASDDEVSALTSSVLERLNAFLGDVTQSDFPVDLYRPARHEVLCGIVTRTARSVLAVLEAPQMWCSEHGAGIIRQLAETEIVMTWMASQATDVYERYQAYGTGKAKLQRRRMSELAEKFRESPPEHLAQALERAERRLGGTWAEEFIDVNLDSNFAGVSVRKMAVDCGLEDLYSYVYQGASSVTHGEWDPIDDQMMTRCLNPLHRWHRLPSTDLAPAHGPELGQYFADKFSELADLAVAHLRVPT